MFDALNPFCPRLACVFGRPRQVLHVCQRATGGLGVGGLGVQLCAATAAADRFGTNTFFCLSLGFTLAAVQVSVGGLPVEILAFEASCTLAFFFVSSLSLIFYLGRKGFRCSNWRKRFFKCSFSLSLSPVKALRRGALYPHVLACRHVLTALHDLHAAQCRDLLRRLAASDEAAADSSRVDIWVQTNAMRAALAAADGNAVDDYLKLYL